MIRSLTLSTRLYARLLVFYPEDLRRGFGAEMALVFADDLDAARREAGLRGVLRVWRCALSEFFRYALPGYRSSSLAGISTVWLGISVAILCFEMAMPHPPHPFNAVIAALILPVDAGPLIILAAPWTCRDTGVISLNLSHGASQEE